MMIVGLTGGMGSGKTTVAKLFAGLGIPVYNSDKEAKNLMRSSGTLRQAIISLLGEDAYSGKNLNRDYIAELVFADRRVLQELNNLVHPAVKKHFLRWVKRQNAPYVIQEAAVLFENGSYKNYDKMILVRAPTEVRISRIMERDGSSEKAIRERMMHQWSDARKSKLSDFIIDNNVLEKTKKKVKQIHGELLKISG